MQMQIPPHRCTRPPIHTIHSNEHVQYIMYIFYSVYVRVCELLSHHFIPPRTVRQLMAGTHHIIMIIIQGLTLSVCDLLLTPVQCYYHSL